MPLLRAVISVHYANNTSTRSFFFSSALMCLPGFGQSALIHRQTLTQTRQLFLISSSSSSSSNDSSNSCIVVLAAVVLQVAVAVAAVAVEFTSSSNSTSRRHGF